MKTITFTTAMILMAIITFLPRQASAQSPEAFKYQTVVRDAAGNILQNQVINLRFKIHENSAGGTVVYSETHFATTNQFGLVSVNIGQGSVISGTFSAIDWGGGATKYLETELDPNGGSAYTSMGTTQLLSVPYAMYAKDVENADDADADSTNEIQNLSISGNTLSISSGNSVTIPSGADNLGNHTATQNIKLSGNWLSNDGGNEGVKVDNSGKVGIGVASPAEKLDVSGKIAVNGKQTVYNAGAVDSSFEGSIIIGNGGDLLTHTTGNEARYNTFIGSLAGNFTSTGESNTFVGQGAGLNNNIGNQNTFIGEEAGRNNESGSDNTFIGENAGVQNITGSNNTYLGKSAGYFATGSGNVFLGYKVGKWETGSDKLYIDNSETTAPLIYGDFSSDSLVVNGSLSVANVMYASPSGKIGIGNTNPAQKLDVNGKIAVNGKQTVYNADAENSNYAGTLIIGDGGTLLSHSSGYEAQYNTFVGIGAGSGTSTGESNTFMGNNAGLFNTSGNANTFIGEEAGRNNNTGKKNTFIGENSGIQNISGNYNTYLGKSAGYFATGSGNVFLGYKAGKWETGSDKLYIDNSETTAPLIYGDFSSDSLAVNGSMSIRDELIDASGDKGASGQVLTSTGTGTDWVDASSLSDGDWTLNSNNMTSVPSGNVGIGVGLPAEKLDVGGKIAINGTQTVYNAGAVDSSFEGSIIIGNGGELLTHTAGNDARYNTFVGIGTGIGTSTGHSNTFMGNHAGLFNTSGSANTFIGVQAGYANKTGESNTFIGDNAGTQNISGNYNTYLGNYAGGSSKGSYNTFVGVGAGLNCINGTGNVFLGYNVGNSETGSNKLFIDNSDTPAPLIYGNFSSDSLAVNGSMSIRDELIDASGDKGASGQVLTSTGTGTDWVDATSINDGDWTVSGNDMYSSPSGNVGIGTTSPGVKLEVAGSPNNAYIGGPYFALYGLLNSTNLGDYAVFGKGPDAVGEDGDGYGYDHTLGGIKGYNYYGNPYTFGSAGFSYLDYNRSGGAYGSDYSGSNWGSLAYKSSSGSTYGGYFTSSTTGSGKATQVKVNNGIGAYGDLFGADIHGEVYGTYTEGKNYAMYSNGTVYKNDLDVHLQKDDKGENRVLYTNVSTDVTVMTSGTAILSNGKASIQFDAKFSDIVSGNEPIVVTVTPIGNSNGVYLNSVNKDGFELMENNNGKSNVTVSYIAIGKRKGYENPKLAQEVVSVDYTQKLQQGLHNDNDTQTDGQGLYYENGNLQVGKHSSTLPPANKVPNIINGK